MIMSRKSPAEKMRNLGQDTGFGTNDVPYRVTKTPARAQDHGSGRSGKRIVRSSEAELLKFYCVISGQET